MNRYLSSERWRKVEAGWYDSPDWKYCAWRPNNGKWNLDAKVGDYEWKRLGTFLTLADCQEHAAKLEGGR